MSIEIKQKIKEVADDFQMPAKEVIEIVGKFYDKPKSSSQNLTEDQLNVVFDYITKQNQIDSLERVFAARSAPAAPAPQPAAAESGRPAASQPQRSAAAQPQTQPQQPSNASAAGGQTQQPAKPKEPERKRERRVIDTSAVTVNADRYDDRVDALVSERVQNYKGGKQKINSKNNKRQQQARKFGTKSRSEEQ